MGIEAEPDRPHFLAFTVSQARWPLSLPCGPLHSPCIFWPELFFWDWQRGWRKGQQSGDLALASIRTASFSGMVKFNLTVEMLVPKYCKMWNACEPNDKNVFWKNKNMGFLSSTTLAVSMSVQSVNYSFWFSFMMISRWSKSQSFSVRENSLWS